MVFDAVDNSGRLQRARTIVQASHGIMIHEWWRITPFFHGSFFPLKNAARRMQHEECSIHVWRGCVVLPSVCLLVCPLRTTMYRVC